MSNPTINFRISPSHLARALQIIRQLEPNYELTSLSGLVKTVFFDYLAKMSINRDAKVDPKYMYELNSFLTTPAKRGITLDDIIEHEKTQSPPKTKHKTKTESTEAEKSVVQDFSPPKDWADKL